MKKLNLFFCFFILSSCHNESFAQELDIPLPFVKDSWLDEVLSVSNQIIFKDSFDYYFHYPGSTVYSIDGNLYYCGLKPSSNIFKREYYFIESDTTLILLKKINVKDSSYTLSMLKNNGILNSNNQLEGCWDYYFFSIEFDRDGVLKRIAIYDEDQEVKPQKIDFK